MHRVGLATTLRAGTLAVGLAVATAACSVGPAPAPGDSPAATNAPDPADTAVPPAPSVVPAVTGKGDATIAFTPPVAGQPTVARFQSLASGPFAVDALDADGAVIANLVDVPDTYDGTVLVDADPARAGVAKLAIEAPGPWSVELQPATAAPLLGSGGVEGERDTVLRYDGPRRHATFTFDGDGQAAVMAYPVPGAGAPDTLVTQAGASQTATPLELPGPALLQVRAQGPWAIQLTEG